MRKLVAHRNDFIALQDEIGQYLQGHVTKDSILESLSEVYDMTVYVYNRRIVRLIRYEIAKIECSEEYCYGYAGSEEGEENFRIIKEKLCSVFGEDDIETWLCNRMKHGLKKLYNELLTEIFEQDE